MAEGGPLFGVIARVSWANLLIPIRPRGQIEWRLDHLKKRRWRAPSGSSAGCGLRALSGLWVKSPQQVKRAEEYSRLEDHDYKSSGIGEHRIVLIESHAAYSAPAGGD